MADEPVIEFQRDGLTVRCLPEYRALEVESLPWQDEDALRSAGELVKTSRSRKVLRIVRELAGRARTLYVKCYHFTDLPRRIKDLLRRSRARAEWETIRSVQARGIATLRPVLVAERRMGPLTAESFLVTEQVEGALSAETVLAGLHGSDRRQALYRLGRVVAALHTAGLYHDDLKAAHILLLGGQFPTSGLDGVILLDLHNASMGARPSLRRRGTNLAQLIRSLPELAGTDQLRLLSGAAGRGCARRDLRRTLLTAMQAALARRRRPHA